MHRGLLIALGATLLCACSPNEGQAPPDDAPGEVAQSSKPRITSPNVETEELEQLAADNADFAWAFYHQVIKPDENLFFSPHSLSVALAMTWAGARGNTATEMAEAMRFRLGQERLHPAFNGLDLELESRAESSSQSAPLPFVLNVTNALFGQTGYTFLDTFLDTLAQHYGAGMRLVDFVEEAEASRLAINAWVSEQTNERIEELLPPGVLTAATRLVLVNAIYFTASWNEPFDEAATEDRPFERLDGRSLQVPTMHNTIDALYGSGVGFEAAEIPYDGGQLAMLVIVPGAGQFDAVESTLSSSSVAQIRTGLTRHQLELALPKFSFRSNVPSKEPLKSLGMVEAFGGGADLSGMNGTGGLFIQDVVHEAFIAVDEDGTEAAAATAVIVGETSAPPPATLSVNRPFVFAIVDRPTGAVLFIGRVLDPSA